MANGLYSLRKKLKDRKRFKLRQYKYRERIYQLKRNEPFKGAPQAKGIVLSKIVVGAKQPNSADRKCVRVQLNKTNRRVSAFMVGDKATKFIEEHDTVLLERIGGIKGGAYGDLPRIKYKVVLVNGAPLTWMVRGRIKRVGR